MKALIQRVSHAHVDVDEQTVGSINKGLLIFLGITHKDTEKQANWLINKLLGLRIFTDNQGKMNLNVQDIEGDILVISQFTLYASCEKGRRPDFIQAAKPEQAKQLYDFFYQSLSQTYKPVETGIFGAKMAVSLENDGPVTLMLESP